MERKNISFEQSPNIFPHKTDDNKIDGYNLMLLLVCYRLYWKFKYTTH